MALQNTSHQQTVFVSQVALVLLVHREFREKQVQQALKDRREFREKQELQDQQDQQDQQDHRVQKAKKVLLAQQVLKDQQVRVLNQPLISIIYLHPIQLSRVVLGATLSLAGYLASIFGQGHIRRGTIIPLPRRLLC